MEYSDGKVALICNNIFQTTGTRITTAIFGDDEVDVPKIDDQRLERVPRTVYKH